MLTDAHRHTLTPRVGNMEAALYLKIYELSKCLVVGKPQLVLRGKNRNAHRTELRLYLHTRSRLRAIKLIDGVVLLRFPRIHPRVQI